MKNIEEHPYNKFIVTVYKPSKHVKGATVKDLVKSYMVCPACNKQSEIMSHGERKTCSDCALQMYLHGASIRIGT